MAIETIQVRTAADLQGLAGLIVPGGESTTMAIVLTRGGFWDELQGWIRDSGAVVWVREWC